MLIDQHALVLQVIGKVKDYGLTGINPKVLSNGGNLILHLSPHPVVARIATVLSQLDGEYACNNLAREVQVARYLHLKDVPVLQPTDYSGPHQVGEAWMTLWSYAAPTKIEHPSPKEAVELVIQLSRAMATFSDSLPVLSVWYRACQSASRLRKQADPRIHQLLDIFDEVANEIRMNKHESLIPAHGDAHAGNLIASPQGWLWIDFEDVSLMPAYWDLASYVGNLVLFGGLEEPNYQYIMSSLDNAVDRRAFMFALTARTLMSTLGNLDYALAGHGDLTFAKQQLELAVPFIKQINDYIEDN